MNENLYIYDSKANLSPLDLLRPQCEIVVGCFTVRERIERVCDFPSELITNDDTTSILDEKDLADQSSLHAGLFLPSNILLKSSLKIRGREEVGKCQGKIVYLRLSEDKAKSFDPQNPSSIEGLPEVDLPALFLESPWDVIRFQDDFLADDCEHLYEEGGSQDSLSGPIAVDHTKGSVYIDPGAVIEPFVHLVGPCYIGHDAVVKSFSSIRSSAICRGSRVSGEISCSTLFPYMNKQHDGFLGHSVVGSWVNIGAGTTGSNLKNTYGEIRVGGEGTGLNYFGQIIGDHTKIGIMSNMNTGSIYGICSSIFSGDGGFTGALPKLVEPFQFGTAEARIDDVLNTARTVYARRDKELSSAMDALIRKRHREK